MRIKIIIKKNKLKNNNSNHLHLQVIMKAIVKGLHPSYVK